MERTKVVRGLRIAWSVWWGILCVLLVVLWVRSYWQRDMVWHGNSSTGYHQATSEGGIVWLVHRKETAHTFQSGRATLPAQLPMQWGFRSRGSGLSIPHWCIILLTGTLATIAGMPWRFNSRQFSLRTMLIATTLIAWCWDWWCGQ